jgi:hypothetical protein
MITKQKKEHAFTPAQLVAALDSLGVPFLRGASGSAVTLEPVALLAALVASNEARLRLALIPLLLAHIQNYLSTPSPHCSSCRRMQRSLYAVTTQQPTGCRSNTASGLQHLWAQVTRCRISLAPSCGSDRCRRP